MNEYNNHETLLHYRGSIWISKLFIVEKRGNICLKNQQTGNYSVLSYISSEELGDRELSDVLGEILKAQGLLSLLEEVDETIITCSVCGFTLHESQVNVVDYDLDVCNECEESFISNTSKAGRKFVWDI